MGVQNNRLKKGVMFDMYTICTSIGSPTINEQV